ncbi:hypothetical protein SLEP1_g31523 [Rubroshorea leprosula]|uniref:Uncharacterized protein n=1 Tax=Rubroshorea leprosula TaxID=152421 RepID=A0AAV5K889_9ROSI|nr:hypothetical protein SLEP1_g31523 [Rubroshorea leprosula]
MLAQIAAPDHNALPNVHLPLSPLPPMSLMVQWSCAVVPSSGFLKYLMTNYIT